MRKPGWLAELYPFLIWSLFAVAAMASRQIPSETELRPEVPEGQGELLSVQSLISNIP